jgi:hypothetical protein
VSARKAKVRREETRRVEAGEHRDQARVETARADHREAEVEERAARARREKAKAEEQAVLAAQERQQAEERHAEADRLDPDVDADAGDRREREERDVGRPG